VNQDEDLDGALRRLFQDERLDMPPQAEVEAAILAGAGRIRRRRRAMTATGGVLAAVLVAGTVLFSADLRPGHTQLAAPPGGETLSESSPTQATVTPVPLGLPPAGEPSDTGAGGADQPRTTTSQDRSPALPPASASTSPRIAGGPISSGPVLGPTGYRQLQLGMSFDDAKATGLLAGVGNAPESCGRYSLREGAAAVAAVTISAREGIVSFQATGAHTPEQIEIGSTRDQMVAAYPDLAKDAEGYTASAGAGGRYVFTVDGQDRVDGLLLIGAGSC
jgi:hypothetical protein